jgi:heavy metal translocating P-type ATPase
MANHSPYLFDEFFASGREESVSPFLTPNSRRWGKNLSVKTACLSALLLLFAFISSFLHPQTSHLCLIGVYFLSGTPALIDALDDINNLEINIDVLMTIAALLSVLIGSAMEGGLLLVLFELSASIENMVTQKARGAIQTLHDLSPRSASVIAADGTLFERAVREITVGTKLLIRAGETIPLDGTVIDGNSSVNLVHLTGETQPLSKKIGDLVPAGGRNLDGSLTISVQRTSEDSSLSRLIRLITEAQMAKPKVVRLFDIIGKWYALSILGLALIFVFLFPLLLSIPYLGTEGSIYRALTFLIAASPCALILATPTAYLSAITSCARRGIVLKGGVILDGLAHCSLIAFDKTGTLTTGKLNCTGLESLTENSPYTIKTALSVAAGLERHAHHPIAEAISSYAQKHSALPSEIENFKSIPGYGLEGSVKIDGRTLPVFIGHSEYIFSKLLAPPTLSNLNSGLVTYLLLDQTLYVFRFTDAIRPGVAELLSRLKKRGLKLFMLTGDRQESADLVRKELELDQVFATLKPEDKVEKVSELSQQGGLIMIGDGVNDAPALSRATVGISMGKIGSATAIDASDVILLQDDILQLDWLLKKAHQTVGIVKQNLFLALAVILFATTPALLGAVPLWVAVILHEGGTVLVGLNSLRLLRRK